MFGKKKVNRLTYDETRYKPVIRASICTGEQSAGFVDRTTGEFREDMLIRGADDLYIFKNKYGIDGDVEKIY